MRENVLVGILKSALEGHKRLKYALDLVEKGKIKITK